MKKIIISLSIVSVCVAACSCAGLLNGPDNGEVPDGITIEEMNEKGYAIKLSYTSAEGYSSDNGSLVYTRKGKKYRWDTVSQRSVYAYYYDRASESGYQYYDEEWAEYDYYRCH